MFLNNWLKNGIKLYGKMALANIMCFIVVFSLTFLSTFLFTNEIGYRVSGADENGNIIYEDLYIHYYEDGKDVKYAEYEAKGYELNKVGIRSEVSGGALTFLQIVSQIIGLGILVSFIYPTFWDIGNKESNAVKFGRIKKDMLHGLKSGLIAIIPITVLTSLIIAFKDSFFADISLTLYKFINSSFYGVMDYLTNHVSLFSDTTVVSLVIILALQFIIPIIAQIAYTLGYKDISIKERLIYKDKI